MANAIDLLRPAVNIAYSGTFAATNVKAALDEADSDISAVANDVGNLVTLTGVAVDSTDLGTFTGSVIPDSSTLKSALQSVETYAENTRSLVNNFEWQASAKDYITDNTAAPPTEVSGDRYILSHDGGAPNAGWDGASAGDVVEFNGTTWDATTPTVGMYIAVDDDSTGLYLWGGSSWAFKNFEATTASTGLTKVGFDIRLDSSAAGTGLGFSAGTLSVDYTTTGEASKAIEGVSLASTSNGLGASMVGIEDSGTLITATTVEGALAENRTAIDAIEDNGIASTNGSISTSGNIGADSLDIDVVFSTAGAANRSIEASSLASNSNGLGASLVGIEDAGTVFTATTVEGALDELEGRVAAVESISGSDWVIKTNADTPYTASDGDKIAGDTSGGVLTVTLPATPSNTDSVRVRDAVRNSSTNAITIGRNGSNIAGAAADFTIDVDGADFEFVYVGATHGWSVNSN